MASAQPGTLVAGRFEIVAFAGSGGMGAVYRARDQVTGQEVALKLLGAARAHAARFAREAAILADLRHPAVVGFVAHGNTADDTPFLAMEWVDGPTLETRLAAGRLSVAETVLLAGRLCGALGAAHRRGVIHRDLKPANVALGDGDLGQSKLLDFGVARWLEEVRSLTVTGDLVGTPSYMSPEQCRGAAVLTPASDLFSLGSLLHECLTGEQLFGAPRVHSCMAKVLFDAAPPVRERRPDVPAALDDLIARLLAKDPADRPATIDVVAAALGSLDSLAPAPAPPPRMGARRLVSVVVARGFDPAGLPTIVPAGPEERLDELTGEATLHGATLESLRDGTLVAVLRSDGDAGALCVRAARLALRFVRLAPQAAVAIATGRTSAVGARPSDVFDAAVRLAGGPGVRVDEVTGGLLEARFDVRGGVLRGERADTEIRAVHGRVLPCVGRDPELAALAAAFAGCVEESAARVFLVTAPAGVGKSRLAGELVRRLAGRDFEVWTGHGDPMSAGSPYGILARATRRSGDGAGRGDEAEPFPDPGPRLRAGDPGVLAEPLARAWRDWLAARCRVRPVLLVLEDLHWGDQPSIHAVDLALHALRDQPLLVLALARPEVHDLFPNLWARHEVSHLRLPGLSRKASERLVSEALGTATPATEVARIVDMAAGNAFYLEELVRARLGNAGATLPETILATVQARLDSLPDRSRRLLRAASVLGQTFGLEALAVLLPELARADLDALCDALCVEEALERRAAGAYAFRHALIHECVYASLPEGDRRHAHRLAGAFLEAGGGDALVIAEHLERGDQPERAIDWFRRAAEEGMRAGDFEGARRRAAQAVELGAGGTSLASLCALQAEALTWRGDGDAEARRLVEQALELLQPGERTWYRALETQAILEGRANGYMRLSALVDELIAHRSPAPAHAAHARALIATLGVLVLGGLTQSAAAGLGRIDEILALLPDDRGLLAARHQLEAFLATHEGDLERALASYREAVERYVAIGDVASARSSEQNAAFARSELGEHAPAEAALRAVIGRGGGDSVESMAEQNLGLVLIRLGRLDEAVALLVRSAAGYARHTQLREEALSRIYLAQAHLARGAADAAEAEAGTAVDLSAEIPSVQPFALAVLSAARLAQGQIAAALEASSAAWRLRQAESGLPEGEALLRAVHIEALAASGAAGAARGLAADAVAWLRGRAERLRDPRRRRSFLEDVPENARLLRHSPG